MDSPRYPAGWQPASSSGRPSSLRAWGWPDKHTSFLSTDRKPRRRGPHYASLRGQAAPGAALRPASRQPTKRGTPAQSPSPFQGEVRSPRTVLPGLGVGVCLALADSSRGEPRPLQREPCRRLLPDWVRRDRRKCARASGGSRGACPSVILHTEDQSSVQKIRPTVPGPAWFPTTGLTGVINDSIGWQRCPA